VRGRFAFERERDLEERILSFDPDSPVLLTPDPCKIVDPNGHKQK
jgi:hypothetical protein